jgi:putative ABC transport system permease protein
VRSGIQATAKVRELQNAFPGARVTVLDSYLSQTLGSTVGQLRRVTVGAVAVGLCIAMLITALFLRMLVRKDARRIAVMTGLGFPVRGIRVQYLTTALLLLVFGIGAGSIFSNTAGQRLVSFLWGFMGAGHIEFVIEPLSAYVLMPALLMGAVALTTLASIRGITDRNLPATIAE